MFTKFYTFKEKLLNKAWALMILKRDDFLFFRNSFRTKGENQIYEQYEALITKTYHSIEKGLSYMKPRLGFGQDMITHLLKLLAEYNLKGFPLDTHCYETALSCLNSYVTYHEESGYDVSTLNEEIRRLPGNPNCLGGASVVSKKTIYQNLNKSFKEFSENRHSVRCFSSEPVEIETIIEAIQLSQNAPSACNRQGWKIHLVTSKDLIKLVLQNQNGNRGFGEMIDKLILISSDFRYFEKRRERFQAYIDGGIYAMNVLYSLHFYSLATVALSASLSDSQERNVKKILKMSNAEVPIMFIGIGNYCEEFKIANSTRRPIRYEVH